MYLGVIILGFVRVSLININTSTVFCWSLIGSHHIRFNLWQGALAAGFSASSSVSSSVSSYIGSSVSSSVGSYVGSSIGSSVGSSAGSSSLDSSSSGYWYSFTVVVLKLVGPLGSCTLHISPWILSSLNKLVHLPLCPVLPSRHTSTSELRGRL